MSNDQTGTNNTIFLYSHSGDMEEDRKLLEPMSYMLRTPGKAYRTTLAKAVNYWLRIPNDKLEDIIEIVNILHTSSIILDDIEDNAVLRRGIPVAHSVYGIAHTTNAANYGMIIALERTLALQHPDAVKVFTEQLLELHRGQGSDIYWRDNHICPTELEYKITVVRKTGGLFKLLVRLMQLFTKFEENVAPLADMLGYLFQIRDDYCNLYDKQYSDMKGYCEDLTEGKFSFPIVHAVQSHPEDMQILNLLKQRPEEIEVKRRFVDLLENFGSFNYTRKKIKELDAEVRKDINRLGGNPLLIELLDKLIEVVKSCDKDCDATAVPK
ncbi:geranylgeranyl pyrophosphate synthase [Harpegnathos saltator]|uniref:Geranylgeranyl pyrophosphate synthetase n=1 Tax=Harpegnathos saltator TaxID=610380 RepID=E2BA75_HARSA|nr:geranylgeranyl pyrophosphate synthase [Harpegnathos saltator]XP_011135033.1 geranylgeranyl pyrophosphate synthase [Harpegnathos saltator]EFN87417.1 Geranylgeranyl pyrophosphate synthetase [Harpegnathos saltator]